MPTIITAKQLRFNLSDIFNLVKKGNVFNVTYKSKPVAKIGPINPKDVRRDYSGKAVVRVLDRLKEKRKLFKSKDTGKSMKEYYHKILDEKYKQYL